MIGFGAARRPQFSFTTNQLPMPIVYCVVQCNLDLIMSETKTDKYLHVTYFIVIVENRDSSEFEFDLPFAETNQGLLAASSAWSDAVTLRCDSRIVLF